MARRPQRRHHEVQGRSVAERRRDRDDRHVGRRRCAAGQPRRHAAAAPFPERRRVAHRQTRSRRHRDAVHSARPPAPTGGPSTRCRPSLTEDRYIKAVEAKPGSPATARAVHHILAYAEDSTTPPALDHDQLRRRQLFQRGEFLVEYSVGKGGERFPEGSGRLIKAGSKIRFESTTTHRRGDDRRVADGVRVPSARLRAEAGAAHARPRPRRRSRSAAGAPTSAATAIRASTRRACSPASSRTCTRAARPQCLELIYPTGGADDGSNRLGARVTSSGR